MVRRTRCDAHSTLVIWVGSEFIWGGRTALGAVQCELPTLQLTRRRRPPPPPLARLARGELVQAPIARREGMHAPRVVDSMLLVQPAHAELGRLRLAVLGGRHLAEGRQLEASEVTQPRHGWREGAGQVDDMEGGGRVEQLVASERGLGCECVTGALTLRKDSAVAVAEDGRLQVGGLPRQEPRAI